MSFTFTCHIHFLLSSHIIGDLAYIGLRVFVCWYKSCWRLLALLYSYYGLLHSVVPSVSCIHLLFFLCVVFNGVIYVFPLLCCGVMDTVQ